MQAQAAGGGGIQELLQNPKVQIGVVAAGAVAIIAVIIMFVVGNRPPTGSSGAPPGLEAGMPGASDSGAGMPGVDAGASGAPAPGAAGPGDAGAGGMGMDMGAGMPGAAPAPGAPADGTTVKKQPPGVPTRRNPFAENKELQEVIKSIPQAAQPTVLADAHDLYRELYTPPPAVQTSDDENEGPPVPPMRVTGIVLGNQVSALMQIGGEFMQVTPGKWIPDDNNRIYRVERIEQGKVVLTRRWEQGNRKGVQRIDVPISQGGSRAPVPGAFGAGRGFNGPPGGTPLQ